LESFSVTLLGRQRTCVGFGRETRPADIAEFDRASALPRRGRGAGNGRSFWDLTRADFEEPTHNSEEILHDSNNRKGPRKSIRGTRLAHLWLPRCFELWPGHQAVEDLRRHRDSYYDFQARDEPFVAGRSRGKIEKADLMRFRDPISPMGRPKIAAQGRAASRF